jgi:hypothetical protein
MASTLDPPMVVDTHVYSLQQVEQNQHVFNASSLIHPAGVLIT